MTMISPMEIKFWAQQLQEWFQTINPYHPPISADVIDTEVQHVRVPPRICVSPVWIVNPYATIEYFQFDGITFEIHTQDEGICCVTYRFIGGIFGLASHFRVFWLDTPIDVRERRWKSYDGKAPHGLEGVILGDIRADHDHCPVPYQYSPARSRRSLWSSESSKSRVIHLSRASRLSGSSSLLKIFQFRHRFVRRPHPPRL
jgi:hypothetical protein